MVRSSRRTFGLFRKSKSPAEPEISVCSSWFSWNKLLWSSSVPLFSEATFWIVSFQVFVGCLYQISFSQIFERWKFWIPRNSFLHPALFRNASVVWRSFWTLIYHQTGDCYRNRTVGEAQTNEKIVFKPRILKKLALPPRKPLNTVVAGNCWSKQPLSKWCQILCQRERFLLFSYQQT